MENHIDLAWAAGLFEGEGSIAAHQKNAISLAVAMTDKDVLDKFAKIINYGRVYGPYKYNQKAKKNNKAYYRWMIADKVGVLAVWKLLEPMLGLRRHEQWLALEPRIKNWKARTLRPRFQLKNRNKCGTPEVCDQRFESATD